MCGIQSLILSVYDATNDTLCDYTCGRLECLECFVHPKYFTFCNNIFYMEKFTKKMQNSFKFRSN
jgi:hypothetical protein